MIDRQALVDELSIFGDVIFCDINDAISYVIVINNWTSDEAQFLSITDTYVVPFYPFLYNFTLDNGVIKCQYNTIDNTII
jgi:hypothetical protein